MIHKHIAKHVKRAHKHVQDHGHKWLRLLSGVFFFILIYPYFSNAQGVGGVTQDICPGGDNSPTYYDCLCETDGETSEEICPIPEETTDLCPNIDEIQATLPENYELDENDDCVCEAGFELDEENNNCVPETTATDLCSNIDGIQETMPAGQELNGDNECVPVEEAGDEATEVIALTGNIVYNPTTSTTGNVTATVVFSTTGVTITNNSGNNTYIFTGNSSFTFTFQNTQGTTGSATATVNWITGSVVVTPPPSTPCTVSTTTPASGAIVGGTFPIGWTASQTCTSSTPITVQLRDHNGQRINIATGTLGQTGIDFTSTGLASTGFYTITGVYLSGTTHSGVTYSQDTIYNIYTGQAAGVYTDFATGYKIRIINTDETILTESNGMFTIDNKKPTLSALTGSFAPLFNGYVGKSAIMTASFVATEQLTGGTTFTILGTAVTPTSVVQTGNTYSFTIPLSSVVASGALAFTAHVMDLAGNTGAIYGTSSVILNNSVPAISNFTFATGTASGSINLSWKTNISTRYNLSFSKSGTVGTTYFTGTTYGTSHTYTMTNIQNGNQYPFVITALNNVDNSTILQGTLHKSTTGALSISLQSSNDILQLSGQAETNLYLQILQNEISKFQSCKAAINFTNQTIPVGNKSITIKIPTITSNSVKQTMLTFLLLFTNKVKEKITLSQAELNVVADAVNNFLVVIKLVDDDNNNCEQKMSTYYLSQFEQLMNSMSFF